ncbi:hypothetical protein RCL1_008258 [Eukaryota sp. TZLM3-RCL]
MIITTILASFILPVVILFLSSRLRKSKVVAFLHPYANDGGGGERVLWFAIQAVQQLDPSLDIVIYSGRTSAETPEVILKNAKTKFGVELTSSPRFVFLRSRPLLEAKYYPFLTILLQSLGSIIVGLEALLKLSPAYLIDTMGYAFTYPLFKFFAGSKVACYVHFPTITTDMINLVDNQITSFNNRPIFAKSHALSRLKLIYYKIFAFLYKLVSNSSSAVMVNSSWTYSHVSKLWNRDNVLIVFPPCDTRAMNQLRLAPRDNLVIAVAQFRPEKNHELMLRSWKMMLEKYGGRFKKSHEGPKLELIGSVRPKDKPRVDSIKKMIVDLGLTESVIVKENLTFVELLDRLQSAKGGLHTMSFEHFGISVVEYMASGVIPIAHRSGGPLTDIVVPLQDGSKTGFLCSDEDEYAQAIGNVLLEDWGMMSRIQVSAKAAVKRFSQESFVHSFQSALQTSEFFS